MVDMTEFYIAIYEQVIPKYVGKENAKDLTKDDVDKFVEEYWIPRINRTWRIMTGWNDEDTKDLENYKKSLMGV